MGGGRLGIACILVLAVVLAATLWYRTGNDSKWDRSQAETCTAGNATMPWKAHQFKSSKYLAFKLRDYKLRHQRCAAEARNFGRHHGNSDCKFVVWISFEGLGNKMLSLASAFAYALVTDRVLLVDRGADIPQLFCEPFPSWFLPVDFPHRWMQRLGKHSHERLGNLNKDKCTTGTKSLPNVVYMHLEWESTMEDKSFFCEFEQQLLQTHAKWLFIRANNYYVPALHLIPGFGKELRKMFPEPDRTFGTIARFLLRPTESILNRSMEYFSQNLAEADQVIGVQMRAFNNLPSTVMANQEQLWSCLLSNDIIPSFEESDKMNNAIATGNATTNILVTSMDGTYARMLLDKLSALKVPRVKVHTPSHVGVQRTGDVEHDKQALIEMLLLSMSDILVTSPRSTFGYVPQGLSGLRPWTLRGVENTAMQQLTCGRSHSSDPGFLFNPPLRDCNCQGGDISVLESSILKPCVDDPARCLQIVSPSNRTSVI